MHDIRAVIFDCDGVLVDSEPPARAVLRDEAARHGVTLDEAALRRFTGLRWADTRAVMEGLLGLALPEDWAARTQHAAMAAMRHDLRTIDGAREVLTAVTDAGLPWAIASNASPEELAEKFATTGLADIVGDRAVSARSVGAGKPDPKLFLSVAARLGVAQAHCLVIEDSRPGVLAARAAGMMCLAYLPDGDPTGLLALGASPLRSLRDFPALLRAMTLKGAA